ncbi:hypothetical protein, variant [Aphanomyces astaci]|uniref:Uncharacterized protein n=1 Tax=Aphanomyces astaci TaxID=112090 RepID=W4G5J0_APHAT|nr:hypothetical protein, variant [Aphanomyces astaci]ETV74193.1 hypothetical protein, variant [Aphanomyces astaci]|eukprot:XP_009836298.1 hypothetical protein, variant [Aphanomyces astaci]
MAGVVATSHAKKGSTVDAGLVLPLPVELDEGEDPTEVIVETILTLGAHILFEKYLNASVVPYTCKWVTRSLDELLAVVTMQTRCDFVLPSWDAVPTAIPLDNLARAMVPVTPVHASRYTMVLSALDSHGSTAGVDDECCIEVRPSKADSAAVNKSTDNKHAMSQNPIPRPLPDHIGRLVLSIDDDDDKDARRFEADRRRKLLQVLDEASQQDQQQKAQPPPSRPTTCPTSPRKQRRISASAPPILKPVEHSPAPGAVQVGFAVYDVQYIDGRVHKRPVSTAGCKHQPRQVKNSVADSSRRQKGDGRTMSPTPEVPAVTNMPIPRVDYTPCIYGNVLHDLVLVPGVTMSSCATTTSTTSARNKPHASSATMSMLVSATMSTLESSIGRLDDLVAATMTSPSSHSRVRGEQNKSPKSSVNRSSMSVKTTGSSPPSNLATDRGKHDRRHPSRDEPVLRIPLSPPKADMLRQTSRPSPLVASRRPAA